MGSIEEFLARQGATAIFQPVKPAPQPLFSLLNYGRLAASRGLADSCSAPMSCSAPAFALPIRHAPNSSSAPNFTLPLLIPLYRLQVHPSPLCVMASGIRTDGVFVSST
eukprot:1160127-Pelagomonas_calceolata.AAC.6